METPIAMIVTSRLLPFKANRLANIIAGAFVTLINAGLTYIPPLFGARTPALPAYLFFATIKLWSRRASSGRLGPGQTLRRIFRWGRAGNPQRLSVSPVYERDGQQRMSRAQLTTADPPEIPMKNTLMLSITSLLSILFVSFHLTSDVLYAKAGSPEAGGSTLVVVPLMVAWVFGALVLAGRRSGYIVILVASLLGLMIPLIHVIGPIGVFSGNIVKPDGAFLFVWTLHSLAVTTLFSIVLSVQGLWSLRRAAQGSEESS